MPSQYQYDWDNFDTEEYTNAWIAFMDFMQEKAKFALKKRALVESLKDMDKEKNLLKVLNLWKLCLFQLTRIKGSRKSETSLVHAGFVKVIIHIFARKQTQISQVTDLFSVSNLII